MDVNSLKSKIKAKQVPSFLIFTGVEWEVQKIYIYQSAKSKGLNTVRIDSIADVYSKLKNKSFLYKPVCYVVRDDKELMTNEKLQQQINTGLLGDNMLILLLTTADKRTKFYKQYKEQIVDFEPLADSLLKKYIQKQINLSDRNSEKLIDICEHDYGRILLEIDKIKWYQKSTVDHQWDGVEQLNINDCFKNLLADGTINKPLRDAIFDFTDAVLDRVPKDVFAQYRACESAGESILAMLSVLYNNAKAVLQVQTCNSSDVSKTTGLTAWQIRCAKDHWKNYSTEELIYMLQLIQKVESGIKVGTIEESVAIPYILVRIL